MPLTAQIEERVGKIEERVDNFDSRFTKMEDSMKDVASAVNGLRGDVRDLKTAKEKVELEATVKLESDRRVHEALSRHGIEEFPSGLHMRGIETKVHSDQNGSLDVTIKQQSAASMFVKYVIETPRYYLAGFLLLLAALLAGGPSVADRVLDFVIGGSAPVGESSRGTIRSDPLPSARAGGYEPAPVPPSGSSPQP